MRTIHMTVEGRVQGVGFRFSAQQKAKEFDVTGWVQNQRNGSVELEAQGEETRIQSFIEAIKHGPSPYAKVTNTTVTDVDDAPSYQLFQVK
ncbi:acylphosphatase [Pontibacillus halophilus JSM 076056 = DSM 19796]|uniref:Acylphosphatase n=1 Tax=Pontibacillus halophilus JSM 076056 = DSM 19796 TaxID=1385510 RepID=A0A0A5GL81_9BACI|nr:acylphosphatase [Pontibacillus halophilus]KGX91973.1 acylphosphatase [Pontibacillus halophilus JSM 076056 = DSM 19796]